MYISPESFLELYANDQLPFFVIYKGATVNEKKSMKRFLQSPSGNKGLDALNEGREILENFFSAYSDGLVTIMRKGHRNSGIDSALYQTVKWGSGSISGTQNNGAMTGMGNMTQFMQMSQFFAAIFKPQMELQTKMLQTQFELQREKDRIKELEDQGPESMQEAMMGELIGLIQPIGHAIAGKFGMPYSPPAQQSAIAGTGETQATNSSPSTQQNKPPSHASAGLSLDSFTGFCGVLQREFPAHNINELLYVLAGMMQQNKSSFEPMLNTAMEEYQKSKQ